MTRILGRIIVLALISAPVSVQAQDRWRIEIVPGAAFATESLSGATLNTGAGVEGNLSYRFFHHVSSYAGWDWHRFNANSSFAGSDVDVEETGYAFGFRFEHPIKKASFTAIFLRAGGTYNHIEIENSAGTTTLDSGHGLGWEVGTGLVLRLSDRWRLAPGMRFRSTTRKFNQGNVTTPARLRYVAIEAGISRSF